jgi:adenylate kinase
MPPKKRLRAVFIGPPGSGKFTQAQHLARAFGVPLVSSGACLRKEIEEESPLGKLVREYVEYGMLAPDELVNAIVLKYLRAHTLEKGFVLEGYPRNIEQASSLERLMHMSLAIQLKIDDGVAAKRVKERRECAHCGQVFHLTCVPPGPLETCTECGHGLQGRGSDVADSFYSRVAVYHFMTEPLVAYYRQRGILLSIKADQDVSSLTAELVKKIKKLGF